MLHLIVYLAFVLETSTADLVCCQEIVLRDASWIKPGRGSHNFSLYPFNTAMPIPIQPVFTVKLPLK